MSTTNTTTTDTTTADAPDADAPDAPHRRHNSSDRTWATLEPLLPGGPGKVGRSAQNNRRFINAVLWVLRPGAP